MTATLKPQMTWKFLLNELWNCVKHSTTAKCNLDVLGPCTGDIRRNCMRLYMLVNLIEYKVQYYCYFNLFFIFSFQMLLVVSHQLIFHSLKKEWLEWLGRLELAFETDYTKKHCLSVRNSEETCRIIPVCECSSAFQVFLHLVFSTEHRKLFSISLMNKGNPCEFLLWYLPKHKQFNIAWFQKISMPPSTEGHRNPEGLGGLKEVNFRREGIEFSFQWVWNVIDSGNQTNTNTPPFWQGVGGSQVLLSQLFISSNTHSNILIWHERMHHVCITFKFSTVFREIKSQTLNLSLAAALIVT